MSDLFLQIEWLRPQLLWLLIAIPVLLLLSWQAYQRSGKWQQVIDKHLLSFMLQEQPNKRQSIPMIIFAILFALMIVASAGPSWSEQEVPVFRGEQSRVILLDLSLSMDAVDIKPTRITRAKHKVLDILDSSKEGETGLVVYAGDAFVISPLTNDANTIATMVPVLGTGLMPLLGSEPSKGFTQALDLLESSKTQAGHIIWITDGIEELDVDLIAEQLTGKSFQLSILAVGTEQGAPINLPDGKGFLKDRSGNIVMPTLNMTNFNRLANNYPINFVQISVDNNDVETIMNYENIDKADTNDKEQNIQNKLDQGYLILLLALPLFFFAFRNPSKLPGISLVIFLCLAPPYSYADFWDDLWLTPDQQAQKALQEGNASRAAQLFNNNKWKASAQYRAENFAESAVLFSNQDSITADYNRGNALAKQGNYDEALEAYDKVLKRDPNHEDAAFNKNIVEQLKKQEEKQQQEQSENNQEQNQQQENEQENEQQENEQEQQSEQEQNSEQQQDQKKQEQQQLEQQEDNRSEQEKQQALEQWLRQIPDDPGGLLRRKMYREYQKRGRENRTVQKIW